MTIRPQEQRPAIKAKRTFAEGSCGPVFKAIALTQGHVALVSDCDYERIAAFNWQVCHLKKAGKFYAMRKDKSAGIARTVFMHREVMNAPDALVVDHVDGDGLDNRRFNLRLCSQSDNTLFVSRPNTNSKSGIRGVHQRGKKWEAAICRNRKVTRLGLFDTKDEAAAAYRSAKAHILAWGKSR
jgi:hypothetical protein